MNKKRLALLTLSLLLLPPLVIGQNTRFSDPDTVARDQFWGSLYADGGTSFFCETPFTSKGFTMTEGHVYPPVATRVEMRRRNARYEQLGAGAREDECGNRESAQFFEPPAPVKGDVARTVAYMVDTYDLPWVGISTVFKGWNRMDPPDDRELTRHRQISELQGNDNPFVTNPDRMANL